jgi:hypothetical protein
MGLLALGTFLLLPLSAAIAQASGDRLGDPVQFERDVQPILESRCLKCHGETKQKAGLRLDSGSAAMAGSDFGSNPVIIPGDATNSLLFQLVASEDEDERMPPRGKALTRLEIDILERWIEEGANSPDEGQAANLFVDHWAYRAPQAAPLPEPKDSNWPRNEIDLFVLDRLEREGLQPSKEADRAMLLRRLSLDLTGLPPTLERIENFVTDDSSGAYENLVDELLASPHYGEHQARPWLDLARYADTNGYEKDARRSIWRYRDWVIDAFNEDMGFDQFTIEQIAGDLLPDASIAQQTATGFHRNTMINAEGGVDPEEYRVAAVFDRVDTTGAVWLGTTMACARCHTHKYDPISHRDYFQLFAYFNSTADIGPGDSPRLEAPNAIEEEREKSVLQELADLETELSGWTPKLEEELAQLQAGYSESPTAWSNLQPNSYATKEGTTLALLNEGSLLALGKLPRADTYEIEFPVPAEGLQRLRIEALTHETLPNQGSARSEHGNFVLSEIEIDWIEHGTARSLKLSSAQSDYHQTGSPAWPAEDTIDGDESTGWAIGGEVRQAHELVVELATPLPPASVGALRLRLVQRYGSMHLMGHIRFSSSPQPGRGLGPVHASVKGLLNRSSTLLTEERAALRAWFLKSAPSLASQRMRRSELMGRPGLPTTLVMEELAKPRTTRILERGSFLSPGVEVQAGVPKVLPQQPQDAAPNRLALARWLVREDNPLTARVAVNRFWAQVFGRGIVRTIEDFGTQGERPSHPLLLDWLALAYQADGWSTKDLMKRMVMSATYRQDSTGTSIQRAKDPSNVLLARGSRYRVPAEVVRDIALGASGLLTPTLGGPSVFPPQPAGFFLPPYSQDRWINDRTANRFRRGLYTFWRRTAPYPAFAAFDAPSRELFCVQRNGSNTPLQALALLNDVAFVEAAVALGARLMREGGDTDASRIDLAFLLCTGRSSRASEVEVLMDLLANERKHYGAHPAAALEFIHSEADLGVQSLDPSELAAWAVLANVLLNLDETITRS